MDEDKWYKIFRPVLGLIAVAQGEGLTAVQLERITGQEVEPVLRVCKQYLDGELPVGPFRPFHRSFVQFLLEDERNVDYHIDAVKMHRKIAEYYWNSYQGNWLTCHESYALRYTPTHLIEAMQQTELRQEGQLWPVLETLLCDLCFVEAKCATGLTYDLEADYDMALAALPEAQPEQAQARAHQQEVAHYTQDLIAYAKAWREARARHDADPTNYPLPAPETIPLPSIATVRLWTDDELRVDTERIIQAPTRLDRLRAFAGFVRAESQHLVQFAMQPGFCVQQAYNSADAGPVVSAAEHLLEDGIRAPLLLQHPSQRAAYTPHPALLRTLEGHTGPVLSVRVTPDGRTAVSGSGEEAEDPQYGIRFHRDNTVRVWDLASGACRHTLRGHTDEVTSVSVSVAPDGRMAVSGSQDKTVRLWDLASGKRLAIFPVPGHSVSALSEITAGGQFGVGTQGGQVLVTLLRNVPFAPSRITAGRLWLFGVNGAQGHWDNELSTRCAHCGQSFVPPPLVLEAIHDLTAQHAPGHSPCLELPYEAWDDPRLLVDCPQCHQPVQFNPFVLDQRKTNL